MTTLPPRDSSPQALAELRSVRFARLREREREQEQARVQAREERDRDARQQQVKRREQARLRAAAEAAADAQRVSRTTLERISDLRAELAGMAAERSERVRAADARIDALTRRIMEKPSRVAPLATTALVAAAVFGGLVAAAPQAAPVSSAIPEAPAEFQQALVETGTTLDAQEVSEAAEVALLEEAEIPLLDGDAGVPSDAPAMTDEEPKKRAVARPRKKRTRLPAAKPKRPAAKSQVLDALGNLDGCGDDPICGLGF